MQRKREQSWSENIRVFIFSEFFRRFGTGLRCIARLNREIVAIITGKKEENEGEIIKREGGKNNKEETAYNSGPASCSRY